MACDPTPDVIARRAAETPDRLLVEEVDGPRLTYGGFQEHCLRWAGVLRSLGVRPGDSVASCVSGAAAYWTWFGAGRIGAVHVPVDPDLNADLLARALDVSDARVLVADRYTVERVAALAGRAARLRDVVVIDGSPPDVDCSFRVHDGVRLLAASTPVEATPLASHAVALGLFTSGTTGASKCAVRTWEMIEFCGRWTFPGNAGADAGAAAGADAGTRDPGRRDGAYYDPWPLFHSTGMTGIAVAVHLGLRLVVRRRFSLSAFWDDVRRYGCTHVVLLVVAPLLLRRPPQPDDADNPLRHATVCPLNADFRELERRFGIEVGTIYGQSESGVALADARPGDHRSVGRPVPEVEVCLVDEKDRPVGPGQVGELLVRGLGEHWIPGRYLGDGPLGGPAESWFRTGDAFVRDEAGDFVFVDRLKDYVRRRGHNISSVAVEAELLTHPDVVECACVGVPSELADHDGAVGDQDLLVVVVARPGSQFDEGELRAFFGLRMPRSVVADHVRFVDRLPRTPTGKVRKAELRARFTARAVLEV